MTEDDLVPETAIDYDEVFRRGGANYGDEGFAFFKCPRCSKVYLLEYEVDTVYLDGCDLSKRVPVSHESFDCEGCGEPVPRDEPWIGPKARREFTVTWRALGTSAWAWAARR